MINISGVARRRRRRRLFASLPLSRSQTAGFESALSEDLDTRSELQEKRQATGSWN